MIRSHYITAAASRYSNGKLPFPCSEMYFGYRFTAILVFTPQPFQLGDAALGPAFQSIQRIKLGLQR
jgi:hypothetical protein